MNKTGKWAKLIVVLGVAMSMVLTGCSTGTKQSESSDTPVQTSSSTQLKPYELSVVIFSAGGQMKDLKEVQDEVNKITLKKFNATVKITPITYGAWAQQTTLMLSGNEKVDVIVSGLGTYSQQAAKGQLLPLNDLIDKYGQGIQKAYNNLDPVFLNSAKIDGKIYGVPSIHDFASDFGFTIRKDLVDKHKIDLSKVKTLDDLDVVFKTIKDNEPDVTPTIKYGTTILDTFDKSFMDALGDGFGVLPNYDNGLKVVNWYETPEYAQLLNTVRRWYQAGYIAKDAATNTETQYNLIKAGKAASWLQHMKPGTEQQESRATGQEMVTVHMKPAVSTTAKTTTFLWSVANNSKEPERAMMFINELFTNKDLVNLLDWGIEGKHYVKTTDPIIDYPEGINAKTTGYSPGTGYMFGNQLLSYIWKGDSPDLWTTLIKFNQDAIKSKALGFSFNAEAVKTEVAAVTNVQNQFKVNLETGTIDPVKNLPEFIQQLKAAGIDRIIAEKQKQLDAWAKK